MGPIPLHIRGSRVKRGPFTVGLNGPNTRLKGQQCDYFILLNGVSEANLTCAHTLWLIKTYARLIWEISKAKVFWIRQADPILYGSAHSHINRHEYISSKPPEIYVMEGAKRPCWRLLAREPSVCSEKHTKNTHLSRKYVTNSCGDKIFKRNNTILMGIY